MKKRASRTRAVDQRVVNIMAVDSSESLVEDLSLDENDFMLVQANDLDKESIHFELHPHEMPVHWSVSAGHEPSMELPVAPREEKPAKAKISNQKTP